MRPKVLLLVGLAIGYVLGARAGRERYEQMRERVSRLWESPRVRRAREEVETYARQQAPVIRARAEAAAKAAPGVITDGARVTAETAKTVADRTAAAAIDVAERTATVAKDVSQTVARTAKDVADKTATAAKDVVGKTATTVKDLAGKTATTANDVAGRASGAAKDVATRTATGAKDVAARVSDTADGVKGRVTATASEVRERGEEAGVRIVSKAGTTRDAALADIDDEDDV